MSRALTTLLKLIYKQIQTYTSNLCYFLEVISFWLVQNNHPVNDATRKLNVRNKALSIAFYNFLTLYTNIPLNKLKNVIKELISFCFEGGEKQLLAVTKFEATWTIDKSKFKTTFDKAFLKLVIDFFLDNCSFNFGNLSFWQINEITVCSDLVLFWEIYFIITRRINIY